MNRNVAITKKVLPVTLFCLALCTHVTYGQETGPETNTDFSLNSPFHNQLFFNRFLINPTFSLVRENKSYLNILHRNQYALFEDNFQNYYLGFSHKLNDHTALGIGVYEQRAGVIQEFGFNANYATSVQLGSNSKLTFGTNVNYLSKGVNRNNVVATEEDPLIDEARKENKITVQPAITLSLGNFDFGLYATDLLKYNQTTNNLVTRLDDRTVRASVQYTHALMARRGLFANARLMPLLQVGKNEDSSLSYIGSVLLDLPKYGWFQSTLDDTYGMSLGVGFNLNRKLSLGYLMEKDLSGLGANLGWNHEISLAYTLKDELPKSNSESYAENYSSDKRVDEVVRNYEEQILQLVAEKNKADDDKDENSLAYQNRLILDEMILRQDSIEERRNAQFEKKFELLVGIVRNEMNHKNTTNSQKNSKGLYGEAVVNKDQIAPAGNSQKYGNGRYGEAVANKDDKAPAGLNPGEHKDYKELPINVLNQSDIVGVKSGYYLIANVYKNKRWLNAFMKRLKEEGLNAKQFYNKENGLYYVYLADFKLRGEAETAFVSNLNGTYGEEKWIMQVDSQVATADVMFDN
ncbi:MAG: type IX secretion system membrane protein PorP/SprF [Saonia sp.]